MFIDDYSRFTWLYMLRSRAELFWVYVTFSTMDCTMFSASIRTFHSDSGGNTFRMSFVIYLLLMVRFLSSHVPVLIPRMAPRNGSIAISLRPLSLFFLLPMFLHIFGLRLSPQLSILSTFSPPLFFRVVVLASVYSLVLLGMLIYVCSDVCVMSYYHPVSGRSSLPSPLHVFF